MDDYKTRMNEEVNRLYKQRVVNPFFAMFGYMQDASIKSFDEFFKLEAMLKQADIPFVYEPCAAMGGFQICYPEKGEGRRCSVILHNGSYGREEGLLEIMGLLTPEEEQYDDVVGYLTADDVFERISNDWKERNNET